MYLWVFVCVCKRERQTDREILKSVCNVEKKTLLLGITQIICLHEKSFLIHFSPWF